MAARHDGEQIDDEWGADLVLPQMITPPQIIGGEIKGVPIKDFREQVISFLQQATIVLSQKLNL